MRDQGYEQLFKAIYSAPWLQAALGLKSWQAERAPTKPGHDLAREALMEKRLEKIKARIEHGGFNAALIRMLIHVVRAHRTLDPRILHFAAPDEAGPSVHDPPRGQGAVQGSGLAHVARRKGTMAALPKLLPTEAERRDAVHIVRAVVESVGSLSPEEEERVAELEKLLDLGAPKAPAPKIPFKAKAVPAAPAEASVDVAELRRQRHRFPRPKHPRNPLGQCGHKPPRPQRRRRRQKAKPAAKRRSRKSK